MRLSKCFVRERLAFEQLQQRVPEQIRVFPVVEPEGDFIHVGVKVLCTQVMVGADDGALEEAPVGLNRLSVSVAPNPFFRAVVDEFVRVNDFIVKVSVAVVSVGVDRSILGDVLVNESLEVCAGGAHAKSFDLEANIPAALNGSEYDRLVVDIPVGTSSLPADISLIHLDDASNLIKGIFKHGRANPVTEIPSRLVGDIEHPLDLISGNTLRGLSHDVDGQKPLAQRKVRVVKDGTGFDRELVAA